MPWRETSVTEERLFLVARLLDGMAIAALNKQAMVAMCRRCEVILTSTSVSFRQLAFVGAVGSAAGGVGFSK
jgi:Flp pilus assembly CpaE family ATPase